MLSPEATLTGVTGAQTKLLTVPTSTVGTQVELVADEGPALAQLKVKPVRLWPGLTTDGMVPNAALTSAISPVTVRVAVSQAVVLGAGAQT